MNKLINNHTQTSKAIQSFEKALTLQSKWKKIPCDRLKSLGVDYDESVISLYESATKRFRYSINLLWKYLKAYLDEKLNIVPEVGGPSNVIRAAHKERVISESDTQSLLEMVKNRNLTSHIYQEEFAQILQPKLKGYGEAMQRVIEEIKP